MSRQFNLELAMAGELVCTRVGRKARIIAFDRKDPRYPLVTLVECCSGLEKVMTHTPHGRVSYHIIDEDDLIMEGGGK